MIIGIDASRANKKEKTGTEWYAYYVIEEIKKICQTADKFILYTKEPLTGALATLPKNFTNKVLKWPPVLLWTQIRLAWEILWHKPDILFVPSHTIPLFSPAKTITTIHDVGFENYSNLYSKKNIGPQNKILNVFFKFLFYALTLGNYKNNELDYHRWSTRLAVKKAALIITVSEFSKLEIIKHFHPKNIQVIYNGYNPKYKRDNKSFALKKILNKYHLHYPYFFYVGRLEEKKNITGLVKAFKEFKKSDTQNYTLVLAGLPGFGYEKIKKILEPDNINNYIKCIGWIIDNDLPYIMSGAQAFVFPSFYEGFGIPIIESMASGTPVITSNLGSMKEIANNCALLVNPYNINEICWAMKEISLNLQLRNNLIIKGLDNAKKYSWQNTAKKVLNAIYSVNV